MALRAAAGFVSPVKPIEPGRPWCVFAAAGEWEWLFHPVDAARHLAEGIVVDGEACYVEVVGEWPMLGAIHLRATHRGVATAFVEDRRAA